MILMVLGTIILLYFIATVSPVLAIALGLIIAGYIFNEFDKPD